MSDLNINKRQGWQFRWTSEEDDIIEKFYPSNGYEKVLALLPHRNKSGIQQRANKLGIKYLTYNQNYFEKINSSDKAYWLGFIYTDGYVTNNNRWGLELSINDLSHMKKLLYDLQCNINIKIRNRQSPKSNNIISSCSFQIKNQIMFENFLKCGVVKNKTEILEFPDISILSKEFYLDFIRGLFDGDGSFIFYQESQIRKDRKNAVYNKNIKEISFVCKSQKFIEKLSDIIFEECGVRFNLTINSRDQLPTLRTSKLNDMKKFINYIYNNYQEKKFLERKFIKAQEILNYCLV